MDVQSKIFRKIEIRCNHSTFTQKATGKGKELHT